MNRREVLDVAIGVLEQACSETDTASPRGHELRQALTALESWRDAKPTTTHRLVLICRCPQNGRLDTYDVTVWLDEFVLVEDIEKMAGEFLGASVYQEDLTTALASRLSARVRVVGNHGSIRTETEAP